MPVCVPRSDSLIPCRINKRTVDVILCWHVQAREATKSTFEVVHSPHLLSKLKHFGDRAKIEIEAVTTAFGEIEAFDRHRHRFHAFPYLRLCVFRREKKLHSLVAWEQLLDRKTHFFQKVRQFSCLVILDVSGFVSLGE